MYRCKGRIPELETARLRLRKMRRRDAAQMFVHWSDREVTRYMNLAPMIGTSEAADMIALLNHMAGGRRCPALGHRAEGYGQTDWKLRVQYLAARGSIPW